MIFSAIFLTPVFPCFCLIGLCHFSHVHMILQSLQPPYLRNFGANSSVHLLSKCFAIEGIQLSWSSKSLPFWFILELGPSSCPIYVLWYHLWPPNHCQLWNNHLMHCNPQPCWSQVAYIHHDTCNITTTKSTHWKVILINWLNYLVYSLLTILARLLASLQFTKTVHLPPHLNLPPRHLPIPLKSSLTPHKTCWTP